MSLTKPDVDDSFDIILPASYFTESSTGECSILVQIEPQDAMLLDFEGASGAIGRFEADANGLTLDLKGYQYDGTIHPGPTTMIVSLRGGELKVEAMTDEFVSLKKTTDVMAKLSAVVQKGNMDASYNVVDDDVNKKEKQVEEKGTTCRELNATTGSNSKAAAVKTVVRITKERRNDGKEPLAKKRTLQTRKRKSK